MYVFIKFMCCRSPEKWKPHVWPIYKETDYEEVPHMTIKTEKSKDLQSASRRLQSADVTVPVQVPRPEKQESSGCNFQPKSKDRRRLMSQLEDRQREREYEFRLT